MGSMMTDAEDRLMVDLFRGYNSLVQPIRNKSELPMIIKIAMQLVLLINVVSFPHVSAFFLPYCLLFAFFLL